MGAGVDHRPIQPVAFRSDEERFERLSFFRIRDIERLTNFVTRSSEDSPRMLYLGADVPSEAVELVKASAYHAAKRGVALRLILLDVAGQEPESQVTAVLEQIDSQSRVEAGPIRGLLDRIRIKPPGGVISIDLPTVGQMVGELEAAAPVAGPDEAPVRLVIRRLQELAEESVTVVMVKENAVLNDVVRNAFDTALRTAPGFVLIQGCERGYEVAKRLLSPDYEVFELCPLERFELKVLFGTRPLRTVFDYGASWVGNVGSFFQPQCYTTELLDWLHRQTQGHPVALSLLWLKLLRMGLIDQNADGVWGSTQSLGAEGFGKVFAESSFGLIERKAGALPGHLREDGLKLLRIAALSGPVAPVALILDFLGITETEDRDDLLDAVDRHFGTLDGQTLEEAGTGWGEENPAVFVNGGFTHEGLPKSLVYLFRSDLFRNAVVVHAEAHGRRLAREFLEFVGAQRPADTRTFALMCRHLAVHGGSEAGAAQQERRLSWWVGMLERADLSEQLRAALRAGQVDAETLWRSYNQAREAKQNQLALALLETFYVPEDARASALWDPAIVPMGRLGWFYYEHAKQLKDAEEYVLAATEIGRALDFAEPGTKNRADGLFEAIMITIFVDRDLCLEYLNELVDIWDRDGFEFSKFLKDLVVRMAVPWKLSPEYGTRFPSIERYLSDMMSESRMVVEVESAITDPLFAELFTLKVQAVRSAAAGNHADVIEAFGKMLKKLPESPAFFFILHDVTRHLVECGCREGDAILKEGMQVLRSKPVTGMSCIFLLLGVTQRLTEGLPRERLADYLKIAAEIGEEVLKKDDLGEDQTWIQTMVARWKTMSM